MRSPRASRGAGPRGLDPVVLRVAVLDGSAAVRLGRRLGRGVGRLFRDRGGTRGGLLPLLPEQPAGGLLRGGDGTVLVALQALAELREARREARGGGADEQERRDELPGQQLARPGARYAVRQPDARQRGLHLDEHAGGELRPREPHDDRQHMDERADGDLLLEPVPRGRSVRQRPPHGDDQRAGHADEQHQQGGESPERLDEIPERPTTPGQGLRRPIPRTRRAARRTGSGASRHGGCPGVVWEGREFGGEPSLLRV